MSARLLEGRPVADEIWSGVDRRAARFAQLAGRPATLAQLSGADEAAASYGRQIERQFTRHGLSVVTSTASLEHIRALNADPRIDGILLMTPLPASIDPEAIDPSKDVDGQHPFNLGRLAQRRVGFAPATAQGGMRLLLHYQVPLRGVQAVVVGRSPVVGMPMALLLLAADATVTVCHSRSGDLAVYTRQADLLCVAAGKRGLIGPEHVKPGAVVVDFGTNPTPDGALVGDVETGAVLDVASAITPVPGGTGPTTVAILAEQTLQAAEQRLAN
jgi:methylenetetrahydrofolate dehydrogenase (NADP+)/methenyltetrahydrofolate cyclohydrolase